MCEKRGRSHNQGLSNSDTDMRAGYWIFSQGEQLLSFHLFIRLTSLSKSSKSLYTHLIYKSSNLATLYKCLSVVSNTSNFAPTSTLPSFFGIHSIAKQGLYFATLP